MAVTVIVITGTIVVARRVGRAIAFPMNAIISAVRCKTEPAKFVSALAGEMIAREVQ